MRHIITILLLLLLIRFVVRVIIPLVRVTRQTANGLKDVQDKMRGMQEDRFKAQERRSKPKNGDYIEYEEVK